MDGVKNYSGFHYIPLKACHERLLITLISIPENSSFQFIFIVFQMILLSLGQYHKPLIGVISLNPKP